MIFSIEPANTSAKEPSLKRATLIYNPVAGRNPSRREKQIQDAHEVLRSFGLDVRLARTTGAGSATELARAAASAGDDFIFACGGDGTINEVINGMCPSNAALGILPGGTANILAKELGLPHDPVRAARQLPTLKPQRIALGCATGCSAMDSSEPVGRYFVSVAGVGFDAYVIHKLTFGFKMSLGVAAYVLEGVRQVGRYTFPALLCQTGGCEKPFTFALIQRTSRYAGWFRTAPRQCLTNSVFCVSLYKSRSRLRYLAYGLSILMQRRLREVEQIETCKVSFAPAGPGAPVYYELDGELAGTLPVTFEIAPAALTLLMPPARERL